MSPFSAKVIRVVDGDTLAVEVRIRTRRSAPSGRTEEGKAATVALARAYPRGREITVSPIVTDQWGRIVATLD